MKILTLKARLVSGEIDCDIALTDLKQEIAAGSVIVLQNIFDKSQLMEIKHEVFELGLTTEEKNIENSARTPNFHRIDDNHPSMAVQRTAHFFRFSYYYRHQTRIFEIIHPLNVLRNSIADLPTDFSFFEEEESFVSQPAVLHYPSGGGYMQAHSDPIDPQKVEMVCTLSEKGKDFTEGGLEIWNGSAWHDIEGILKFGDVCLFRPNIPHRVAEIDPFAKKDFRQMAGKWTVFSPIASIAKEAKNERAVPLA